MSLMGQSRPVRGMACREADGRWHLVSELPLR
jgi:surface antigen